jgi:hypothetical protein
MGFVGLPIAQALPPAATKVVIGAFVLVATRRILKCDDLFR